jgi:hypothetical protein
MEQIGMGKEVAEKPRILITGELAKYHKGYLEFYTHKLETGTEQEIRHAYAIWLSNLLQLCTAT